MRLCVLTPLGTFSSPDNPNITPAEAEMAAVELHSTINKLSSYTMEIELSEGRKGKVIIPEKVLEQSVLVFEL